MPAGFFKPSELQKRAPVSLLPKCGACGLYRTCHSPKMKVGGQGRAGVLLVGEHPSASDDKTGRHFAGQAGNVLRESLALLGVDLDRDCWSTYAAICKPGREPPKKMVEFCRPNLIRTINELKPKVVVPLGFDAVKAVVGHLWRDNPGSIGLWHGWDIPCKRYNAWICPTWSPADFLTEEKGNDVKRLLFNRELEAAFAHDSVPFKKVTDSKSKVRVIMDPDNAPAAVREMVATGRALAVDYETDRLKPDRKDSRIVCFSVSDGRTAIAYPWAGPAVEASRKLLASGVPLIASNMKFEERWTMRHLGAAVKNWLFDTMLAAHVLDNREGCTSIKFQAFVLLGEEPWNRHVEKHFESDDGLANSRNNIKQVAMADLLLYCGLDSLFEWRAARIQRAKLNMPEADLLGV